MRSAVKRKMNFSSLLLAFRDSVFSSVGIEEIYFEEFYMLGWWIALGCFTISIDGLRRGINFLSVYTIVLSFILLFLMILLGKVSGRRKDPGVVE